MIYILFAHVVHTYAGEEKPSKTMLICHFGGRWKQSQYDGANQDDGKQTHFITFHSQLAYLINACQLDTCITEASAFTVFISQLLLLMTMMCLNDYRAFIYLLISNIESFCPT